MAPNKPGKPKNAPVGPGQKKTLILSSHIDFSQNVSEPGACEVKELWVLDAWHLLSVRRSSNKSTWFCTHTGLGSDGAWHEIEWNEK